MRSDRNVRGRVDVPLRECEAAHMSDQPHTPDLLKADEVVQLLGINRSTLTRWETAGHLVPVRIGSRYVRYRRNDLESLLNAETKR